MASAGHVFVVHGDLERVACDLYLIPTDVYRQVTPAWLAFGTPPSPLPEGWGDAGVRVTDGARLVGDGGQRTVRWVNTGSVPDRDGVDWLEEAIRQALAAASKDLFDREARYNRARPLIGMPVFGVGQGGFDKLRGAVLDMLLGVCAEVATESPFDIAIVCYRRADYAALQSRPGRCSRDSHNLSDADLAVADALGVRAREGRLVLFLGAGVSVPAGLPDWEDLLHSLGESAGVAWPEKADLMERAQAVLNAIGEEEFRAALTRELSRQEHALGHGLLASLRVREAVTTNFDDLYELAARVAHGPAELSVLPWDSVRAHGTWLLKMHGGIGRSHVVFTTEDYAAFDARWRPLAGVVQAMLMTRHVFFVGYGLRDEHFVQLGTHVLEVLRGTAAAGREVGTVLSIGEKPEFADQWGDGLRLVPISNAAEDLNGPGRRIEIFLDRVAAVAAARERSYLLDARYAELLPDGHARALAADLRSIAARLPADDPDWHALGAALESMGMRFP